MQINISKAQNWTYNSTTLGLKLDPLLHHFNNDIKIKLQFCVEIDRVKKTQTKLSIV